MRKIYLVVYDITNQKRWSKIYKIMRGYGDHAQLSVFICNLSDKEYLMMTHDIDSIINHSDDKVMIADLGPAHSRGQNSITFFGKPYIFPERCAIIA